MPDVDALPPATPTAIPLADGCHDDRHDSHLAAARRALPVPRLCYGSRHRAGWHTRNPQFLLMRMILSENRFPLFGIVR
ncbi:MAG: hypothetical protein AB7O50_06115 [Pseudolabrys sp.]